MGKVNVFLDTNVLVDYLTGRMGNDDAKNVILCGKTGKYDICVSILTVVNALYVIKRGYGLALDHKDIEKVCIVLGQRIEQWKIACGLSEIPDFEDAVQVACAIDNNCSVIISRDGHYQNSPIRVYTPSEFIRKVTI